MCVRDHGNLVLEYSIYDLDSLRRNLCTLFTRKGAGLSGSLETSISLHNDHWIQYAEYNL